MLSLAILASKVMSTHRMVPDRTLAALRDKWELAAATKIQAAYRGYTHRAHTVMTCPCGSYIECKFHKFHGDVQYCCGTAEAYHDGDYVDTFLFCNQAGNGCAICGGEWIWDDGLVCPCGQHA
jgi:hypothetical protein